MNNLETTNYKQRLQDALEAEFCPPLDTTLVAAISADYESKDLEKDYDAILEKARESLTVLAVAAAAAEDNVTEMAAGEPEGNAVGSIASDDRSSLFDPTSESSSISSSSVPRYPVASTPASIDQPMNTPSDFLRASFPNIAASRIHDLIGHVKSGGKGDGAVDMELIVEQLLNEEYMRELDERGMDAEFSSRDGSDVEENAWILVDRRRSKKIFGVPHFSTQRSPQNKALNGNVKKKSKVKGKTIALVDVRQSQHRPLRPRELATGDRAAPDLWNQISSLSAYLSDLLPPNPPSYFVSFFHSPEHETPAAAVRASIAALSSASRGRETKGTDERAYMTALFALFDLICSDPSYDALDSLDRERIYEDAQLALEATNGRSDVALDIVTLLRDLDKDGAGVMQMGVYHSPASISLPSSPNRSNSSLPLPSVTPFGNPVSSPSLEQASNAKPVNNGGWQTVKPRPPKPPLVHPLAAHIPAYDLTPGKSKGKSKTKRGSGNTFGMGGKGDVGELGMGGASTGNWREDTGRQISECRRRRDEALRDAGRYWQQGNVRTRGGEIAQYFAEKFRNFFCLGRKFPLLNLTHIITSQARILQEQSKQLKLDAARKLVDSKRVDTENGVTIDLHYTTVNESLQIVREVLDEGWVRQGCPLHIITGKGSHSVNGVSVLGPAVKRALDAEGWLVTKSEIGLVVRGRENGRRRF